MNARRVGKYLSVCSISILTFAGLVLGTKTAAQQPGKDAPPKLTGKESIVAKLRSIRIPEASFVQVKLPDAVKYLSNVSLKSDPEKRGINFLINAYGEGATRNTAGTMPDLREVTVTIQPGVKNMRLEDVLNAVVGGADKAIQWRAESYAIIFSPKAGEPK